MSKVILQGYIVVPTGELELVKTALKDHIVLTLAEPGCIQFEVKQRSDEQNIFDVYEEFINSAAFETHQQRSQNSAWGAITKNVDRHYEIITA